MQNLPFYFSGFWYYIKIGLNLLKKFFRETQTNGCKN